MKIPPDLIKAIKDTLATVFWFKNELSGFLERTLTDPGILNQYDWEVMTKREVANEVIDLLISDLVSHGEDLSTITRELQLIDSYPGLQSCEDAEYRIETAKRNQQRLRSLLSEFNRKRERERKKEEDDFAQKERERRNWEDQKKEEERRSADNLRTQNPDVYFGRILKLNEKPTLQEIQKQYRQLVQSYHPDKFHHLDSDFVTLATRKTQEIIEAFNHFKKAYGIQE